MSPIGKNVKPRPDAAGVLVPDGKLEEALKSYEVSSKLLPMVAKASAKTQPSTPQPAGWKSNLFCLLPQEVQRGGTASTPDGNPTSFDHSPEVEDVVTHSLRFYFIVGHYEVEPQCLGFSFSSTLRMLPTKQCMDYSPLGCILHLPVHIHLTRFKFIYASFP